MLPDSKAEPAPGAEATSASCAAPAAAAAPASLPSVLDAVAGLSVSDTSSDVTEDLATPRNHLEEAGDTADEPSTWRPTAADIAAASSGPLLVAADPSLPYQRILSHDPRCLPVNDGSPIEFETPCFSGRACVWVRGAPGTPASDAMFAGRQRRSLVTVQGRFSAPLPLDDVVTGQEFERVQNLPPAWLVEGVLLKVARAVSPSMTIGPLSAPHMLMPVISGCSEIHCCRPGEEPDPAGPPREDLRAWDPSLAAADGSPMPAAQRKRHFSRAENRAGRCFSPDLVFTLYFYQHVVNCSTYELDVLYRFKLARYIADQPLQLMMRRRSAPGEFLYRFLMHHECLLLRPAGG